MDMFPFPVVSVILAANDTVLATPNIPKTADCRRAHSHRAHSVAARSLTQEFDNRERCYLQHVESLFKCSIVQA